MKTYSEKERQEYIKTIPKKRSAVGVILRNHLGEILLLQTYYHGGKYTFPGGVVDEYESPWMALSRELKEETGIISNTFRLLTLTNISNPKIGDEMMLYYFDGGVLTEEQISKITYMDEEVIKHLFVPEELVLDYLRSAAHVAYKRAMQALHQGKTLFFDEYR